MLGSAQTIVFIALAMAALVVEVVALVDAARRRPDAFVAAGKMTKQRWLIILGVATALGFVSTPLPPSWQSILGPLQILSIVAFVAAAVYHVDVKPALKQVQGGGRGTSSGPYGPW
ncbi:DUF2516 family protein [Angustibacter luteus]|uniref:DUF2516 family protein n=1 Tax=Angustibacter luteus TaxID=658456 RepID=A0ABW1JBS1_9ACTN